MASVADAKFRFDPFSKEVVADPEYYFRELRDKYPVYYNETYDTHFISRFEDVWNAMRIGNNVFVETEGTLPTPEYLRSTRNEGAPPFVSVDPMAPGPMLPSPYFEEVKQAHMAPFRPRGVAVLKDFIVNQAQETLDALIARGKFDLSIDYAGAVSSRVICHLFGMPLSVADKVLQRIGEIGKYRPETGSIDLMVFWEEMKPYISPRIEERREAGADGSDGLIDGLINYRTGMEGRALSDVEIADQLVCAMVGGMESVPKVTSAGIMELYRRPDQLAAIRADMEANMPLATEEIIRFCSPGQYTFRTVHQDVTIGGAEIKAGQRVAFMLGSLARDEREFENPDAFIWNRRIPRVLSFGVGLHQCIGKHLAVLEVKTLVQEFISRVDKVEFLLDEASHNTGYFQRGWTSIPVRVGG